MRVWLQIQGSRVWSQSGPILSWRLIMKWFLRSFSFLPLIHSRRVVVSYKRKYVHELLVNRLFTPAQEKSVVRWTDSPAMTIAVDLGRKATKQTNKNFALNISDKTCLANLNSRFLWAFKTQFEVNISLSSLINILSRRSRLLSGEMNAPWNECPVKWMPREMNAPWIAAT